MSTAVTPSALADQLLDLGVEPGGVLIVHSSYRAIRPVEGGPQGVVDALRRAVGPDGTIVMPSWPGDDDHPFDPVAPSSADLGVIADTFWRQPGAVRTDHPFTFAALGPHARRITSDPLPVPPHRLESPIGRVWELDGQVLLLGVGHDSNTTIHLAEVLGGAPYRVPKHITHRVDGRVVQIDYGENDHCCQRFTLADAWLRERGLQREGPAGHGQARLIRSRDVVEVVVEQVRRDPVVFLHPRGSTCEECEAAWRSIP
ncbi:MAG TPA: AAC(3)-IV family aminoglycoside N-acetyltransferase [Gemmatimonadaceae bacterium]|nr:AAC(3)-IV family aminoglycoside N-acetyltransferase [Gemmatimonadaceae bacterium]